MVVAIFKAGRGRNSHSQACAREIWLARAIHNVTLTCTHIPGECLVNTADALSRFHLGAVTMTGYMNS